MISRRSGQVSVWNRPVGHHDEDGPLLHGRTHGPGLPEPVPQRPEPVHECFRMKKANDSSTGPNRTVYCESRVGVHRRLDVGILHKLTRLLNRAIAHNNELGAGGIDLWNDVTQLRDLLFAEHSAEVADEDQDDGLFRPQSAEAHRLAREAQDLYCPQSSLALVIHGSPPIGKGP